MLLTIFNLPVNTRYSDIKSLIQTKCGFKEIILDNLKPDSNNSKKVTVGLAEEEDAAILVRKINGLHFEGQQLYVESIKKKQYEESNVPAKPQPNLQQPYYQQTNYQQPAYQLGYTNNAGGSSMIPGSMTLAGMYGVPTNQNAMANYGYPQQMQYPSTMQPLATFDQGIPLGFNNQGNNSSSWSNQNNWNPAGKVSVGNQNSHQGSSRWENSGDSGSRSNRDGLPREQRRDAPSRDYERAPSTRDFGRNVPPRDFRRDESPRGYGRDAPVGQRGRDAPFRDRGRDAPVRERGHVPHNRDYGRDANVRDFGRDAPDRDHRRDVPDRDHGRDPPYKRNERAPPHSHPKFSSRDGPPKYSTSYPKIYGEHVTGPSPQLSKFSQQRNGSKYPVLNKPEQKLAPSNNRNKQKEYVPPAKRQRKDFNYDSHFNEQKTKIQPQTPSKKKNKTNYNPEMLPIRASTWRCQIASSVAKEIIKKQKFTNDIEPDLLLTELKKGIRQRLEAMFGDNYEIKMADMVNLYREKYDTNSDVDFFNEVTEAIKKSGSYLSDEIETAVPDESKQLKKKVQKQPQQIKQPPQQVKKTPDIKQKIIPSYPQGDKKLNKEHKKINQTVFKDEDTLLSQLKPNMQQALDEVVGDMCKLISQQFQEEEPAPEYKTFHQRISTTVINDLKKVIKVNIAKRVLNVGPFMLRIFNTPKIISRGKLAPILAAHGITSLRKSEKKKPVMYIGTCASYKIQDKLCSMKPLVVDGSTILIKPFQLAGQNEKMSKEQIKKHRQNVIKSYTNLGEDEETLDDADDVYDEDVTNIPIDCDENEQDGNDNEGETNQDNIENESNEITETIANEYANENLIKLEGDKHETNESDGATKTESVKTEVKNEEGTEENNSKVTEETNKPFELKKEDNENIDGTEKPVDELEEDSEAHKDKNDVPVAIDFTEDVNILQDVNDDKNTFEIAEDTSGNIDHKIDEHLKELKEDDLEDFVVHQTIDDIDIADLNDDDLEDWC